jgi:hypothetical protein
VPHLRSPPGRHRSSEEYIVTISVSESHGRALRRVADGDVIRDVDWTYRAYGNVRDLTDRIYQLEDNGWVELHADGSVVLTARGTGALLRWHKAQRAKAEAA